jgi:hypothetical protein
MMMTSPLEPDRREILAGYQRAHAELRQILASADRAALRRRSSGTRWTNEQLLFHMVFGYMVVRALLPLVRVVSRLPRPVGRAFAGLLNAGTVPFDVVNYWGSRFAAVYFNRQRMAAKLERTLAALSRRMARESEKSWGRAMDFPSRWDPFFTPQMTLGAVYAYPTLHFDFHRKQLSLDGG